MEVIRCNQCGRLIIERGSGPDQEMKQDKDSGNLKVSTPQTDYLKVTKTWGYFSNKDLEIHEFCLCEDCYDAWIQNFLIPVTKRENKEVLGL